MPHPKKHPQGTIILGAGMTGLAAGYASGAPIYEAAETPGGICSSYYMRPAGKKRLRRAPADQEAYRFELGGGHWIFGGDPFVRLLIHSLAPCKTYDRRASIYLPDSQTFIPYPLQNNLYLLPASIRKKALAEMLSCTQHAEPGTLREWLKASFGETLCKLFFWPFHELYTAGLYSRITPQDSYKSPLDTDKVAKGAKGKFPSNAGYNTSFVYPADGLDALSRALAARSPVFFGKRAVRIDTIHKTLHFKDGTRIRYTRLLSTLPLNATLRLAGLSTHKKPDPSPSVLVINIGAVPGKKCPLDHWVYVPSSEAGFHRVGFYSNVDSDFLPLSARKNLTRVSLYVEKAYSEGAAPDGAEIAKVTKEVVAELIRWDWIKSADIADPTWIETAYTWSWSGSSWKEQAIQTLENAGVYLAGRYARWTFQGIADSIRDGILAGNALCTGPSESPSRTRPNTDLRTAGKKEAEHK